MEGPPAATATEAVADARLGDGLDDRPVVHEDGRTTTRAQLRAQVAHRREDLALPGRRVVVLVGRPSREWVVTYLALLADGHVPLLAGERSAAIEQAWSPAAVVQVAGEDVAIDRRGGAPDHDLHPDLALLLSTSGSTGSPKLVRLSHANLVANARAIATSLELTERDVAITALPLHYCYGLSVLHAHLVAGASVVAIDASVVDPCFAGDGAPRRSRRSPGSRTPSTCWRPRTPSASTSPQPPAGPGRRAPGRRRDRWAAPPRWGVDLVVM
ncbi:MAG: AMP-binding protein [Acidimicrobiales bacterium]